MKAEVFFRAIEERRFSQIYLFEGETYFVEKAWEALVAALRIATGASLSTATLSLRSLVESEVVDILGTRPLGVAKKALLIKDLTHAKAEVLKAILRFIEKPNPWLVIVFFSVLRDARAPTLLVEAVRKATHPHVTFHSPKAHELPQWIRTRLRQLGKGISFEHARYLAEMIGPDFLTLEQEIEKVFIASGDRRTIGEEEMAVLSVTQRISSLFEVMDRVAKGLLPEAMQGLQALFDAGEQPIAFLGLVARHLRLLWQVKAAMEGGMSLREAGELLKLPEFLTRRLGEQCRTFSHDRLRAIHRKLYEADIRLKSTALPPLHVIVEILLSFSHAAENRHLSHRRSFTQGGV